MVIRLNIKHLFVTLFAALAVFLAGLPAFSADEALPASADGAVTLPVIMYHSILKDPALTGTYVLPPEQLEADLCYLKENGYTAVTMREVLAYVDGTGTLPQKPVVLTFDDGYYNNYVYVYPLMKQYGMKCVLSVFGRPTDELAPGEHQSPNYSHVSWEQISEMSRSGLVEIANHSYDMHTMEGRRGASKRPDETEEAYRQALTADVGKLQQLLLEHTGKYPVTFAYPYGQYAEHSEEILSSMGFRVTLSCDEGLNQIRPGDELSMLRRCNRAPGETSEAFFGRILSGG